MYDTHSKNFRKADILANDNGIISAVGSFQIPEGTEEIPLQDGYLLPGLVDVHTHGCAGYDFNTASTAAYPTMLKSYALSGTTSVMATLASAPFPELKASAVQLANSTGVKPGSASFIGLHLEGRYLSPHYRGAHAASLLANPVKQELDELLLLCPNVLLHISLAPELPGAMDFISYAVSRNATVAAVHTDADYACISEALACGVTAFSHTFNAMRPIHHREPGVAVAALLSDDAWAEFIADGEHLHPAMLHLAYRTKPEDKLVLVTDSMEATGMSDGRYAIAGQPVIVKNGRAMTEEGKLAGSTLTLFGAITNMMRFCQLPLETVLPFATINPAKMVGIDSLCGSIEVGKRCDLLLVRDKEAPSLEAVWTSGVKVS